MKCLSRSLPFIGAKSHLFLSFKLNSNATFVWRISSKNLKYFSQSNEPKVSKKWETIEVKPKWIPFCRPKYGQFTQEVPKYENQFLSDSFLQKYLQRNLPKEV